MPTSFSDDPPSVASMHPGLSQAGSQAQANRPAGFQLGRTGAPASVSRSEAGISVDLSAASNTAANGEDHMEITQRFGSSIGGPVEQKTAQHAKSKEAEKWFEDSNKNASTRGNVSFVDDDPPFHLPSQLPNDFPRRHLAVRTNSSLQAPALRPMESMQSSGSEEFRSVIDDLTVENKKLRKENRQLLRRNATHTHPDKLFEVRMHGLEANEKKQLMQLLRNFNESLSKGRGQDSQLATKQKRSKGSSNKPSSSSTLHSNSNPVDSAYASGSTSGNASGSQSQLVDSRTAGHSDAIRQSHRNDKNQNVRSYLINTSRALLPRQPAVMTEMARKKLAVRKLEQLFTGKPNTSHMNSQSDQQQQVSTEAANEFKRQTEAVGRTVPAEGSREAVIFSADNDLSAVAQEGNGDSSVDKSEVSDQRPTRPIDLDLSRAQNPAENIAYIHHLGFRHPTDKRPESVSANVKSAWIPLNLLMNLAQLHTLNVTPGLVREALKEISVKFDFSSDETKVRWKGGSEGTRIIGDTGSSTGSAQASPNEGLQDISTGRLQSPLRSRSSKPSASDQTTGAVKSSDRIGSGTTTNSRDLSASTDLASGSNLAGRRRPLFLSSVSRSDSISYQPIFLHAANSEEEGEYFLDEEDSLLSSGIREDTTGSGSGQRSKKHSMLAKEDSTVIFYHRAKFCTDLSGDHNIVPVNTTQYSRANSSAIGSPQTPDSTTDEMKGILTADEETRLREAEASISVPTVELVDLQGPLSTATSAPLPEPVPMPVTGIGNTLLSDNVVLWARYIQMARPRHSPLTNPLLNFVRARYFDQADVEFLAKVNALEVFLKPKGSTRRELPPSELPSPGFYNQWSSSESTDGLSEMEQGEGDSKSEDGDVMADVDVAPTFGFTAFESHSGGVDSDVEQGDGDTGDAEDDSDGDEIDLLAYERKQNAEETARREREWEEQARLAEDEDDENGKCSSAATVGDRSFLSDEDNMSPGRTSTGALAGQKRERDDTLIESSPAKRVDNTKTKNRRA